MNPKSITIDELYGNSDVNTLEWSDGLLGSSIRNFVNQSNATDVEVNYQLFLIHSHILILYNNIILILLFQIF